MQIEWFGQACIKVQTKPGHNGEVTCVFDPFDPKFVGLKLPKLTADIVAITHDHEDHNYQAGVEGDFFLIQGPGEYEVKQTFLYGIPGFHDNKEGAERGVVTMYLMQSEGLSLAHLGDLGQTELTDTQLEQLEGVDILILPIGGIYTLDGKQAAEIVKQIEPRLVIPVHYYLPGLKVKLDGLDKFIKVMGTKMPSPIDKLKISKKDLLTEDIKIILLSA